MAPLFDRITHSPDVLGGRAAIRGYGSPVAHVVNLIANGMTPQQVASDLPDLDLQDIQQSAGVRCGACQGRNSTRSAPEPMRFLADAGISPNTVEFLARLGHRCPACSNARDASSSRPGDH